MGTRLNCIAKSMQFKWVPTTNAFIKKLTKIKNTKSRLLIFLKCNLSIGRYIFTKCFPSCFFFFFFFFFF